VGASESAVANAFETAVRAFGPVPSSCQVAAFAHVVSGSRSTQACLPGVLSSDRLIQTGDPVLVQVEVCVGGYWVNASRTFFAGDPGAEGRRIYAACLEAGERARAAVRNGALASDVDAAARSYLADDGFGPCMRGAIGHGVGFEPLSIRQPPRLFPGSSDMVETDMAIALRPGVFVKGWGGVRIGDVVIAEARGSTLLTNIPRDLAWATVPQRARC
jgi:Xaa-Pro aminopeptidase